LTPVKQDFIVVQLGVVEGYNGQEVMQGFQQALKGSVKRISENRRFQSKLYSYEEGIFGGN
jgi:hypothetical protein